MRFKKIFSAAVVCSLTLNMLGGSILTGSAYESTKTVSSTNASYLSYATVPTTANIKCESCQSILKYRSALYDITTQLANDPKNQELLNKRSDYEKKINSLLSHECSEKTVYVENYPYVLHNFYGTYTGDWKGGSPDGSGNFVGFSVKDTSAFDSTKQVTNKTYCKYTHNGNWLNGRRDGVGQYIMENISTEIPKSTGKETITKYTSTSYNGEFKDNYMSGKGYETQVLSNGDYIIFGEGTYKDNSLQGTIAFEKYNSSDKLIQSGTAKEDENGKKVIVTENKSQSSTLLKGALIAGAVIGGAALIGSIFSDDSDSSDSYSASSADRDAREYWDNYHAEQAEKKRKEQEEIDEQNRKQQQYEDDQYHYYQKTYGDDDPRTQKWKKWSGN
ncbi:MAG: hypothetical protein IJ666_03995 [Ruminococcus sp.]|nr:hypothetical protein [Ruminococcus sp.]